MSEKLKFFDDLWISTQPNPCGMADFWDRRAVSFNAHRKKDDAIEHGRHLTELLITKAGLNSGSRLLDIGCGAGHYALVFARRVAEVTGLDISAKMIEFAKGNAEEEKLSHAHFEVLDWTDADLEAKGWQKKFDFVLASKTPAVNSWATLKKMMDASRGYCCLISQVDTEHSIRDQLKPLVIWDEEKARISRTFYCAFNLLWLQGYFPEVSYLERSWEEDLTLEDAELLYINYFESLGVLKPEQKKPVIAKLTALAAGGIIHEEVKSKAAMLFWKS